ncbi:MAG: 4'-phosphopantetheinyl transferase superfamily protein [Bacteroidia bacterium]|nr:4'-phosphopantetheinyl transferase superfamily protein [Bacteroidia bacterium]
MNIYWVKRETADVPVNDDWLHPSEKEVYSTFRFPKKQSDWKLGRWTAKCALSHLLAPKYADLNLNDISITNTKDGAPEAFCNDSLLPISISLSHSHSLGFCVVCDHPIQLGCDLELMESRSDLFINDYFNPTERAIIRKGSAQHPKLWATLLWSAKESTLKALKTGLKIDTRLINIQEVSNGNDHWNPFKAFSSEQEAGFYGFWKQDQRFVYTIVSNEEDVQLIAIV